MWPRCGMGVLLGLALLVQPVLAGDVPQRNELNGQVVRADDGRPVAGVPVHMIHGEQGWLRFTDGGLDGAGASETVMLFFTKLNSKHHCSNRTDSEGRFTLSNFAAPDGLWAVAAGDPAHGYDLLLNVRPVDHADAPLTLKLREPGYVEAETPSDIDKKWHLMVTATPVPPPSASPAGEGPEGEAGAEPASWPQVMAYQSGMYVIGPAVQTPRLGPLPGGHTWQVTARGYAGDLPYQPTLLQKRVLVPAGETVDLKLAAGDGATVTGKLTDKEGQALPNVNVMIETADHLVVGAVTDKQGAYKLAGVPSGTHQIKLLRHAQRLTAG